MMRKKKGPPKKKAIESDVVGNIDPNMFRNAYQNLEELHANDYAIANDVMDALEDSPDLTSNVVRQATSNYKASRKHATNNFRKEMPVLMQESGQEADILNVLDEDGEGLANRTYKASRKHATNNFRREMPVLMQESGQEADILNVLDEDGEELAKKTVFFKQESSSMPARIPARIPPSKGSHMEKKIGGPSKPRVEIKYLTRKELFDDFAAKDHFDLTKVSSVKTKIRAYSSTDLDLSFYGVEQLTDAVFYLLSADKVVYDKVMKIDLTGCHRLTDHGVKWMADTFQNVTEVLLVGCYQVTETGIHYLVNKCTKLKALSIKGTNVAILPRQLAKVTIDHEGYPCISPELDVLKKQGRAILQAPAYAKPDNEDIVKMVVVQTPSAERQSLVKYLNTEKSTGYQPLHYAFNMPFGSRFKVNAIECDEVLTPLLLTKRTLYVFPVYSDVDVKETTKKIFGYVSYISSQVSGAAFLLMGISNKGKAPVEAVAKEIKLLKDKLGSFYSRKAEGDSKSMLKGDSGKNLDEQENFKRTVVASQQLQNCHLDSVQIDMAKPFSATSETGKKFESALAAVCNASPEIQELAGPMFTMAAKGDMEKLLQGGVMSMDSLKSARVANMELMAVMGRMICYKIIQDVEISCSIPWLAKLVNIAFMPPEGSRSSGNMTNLKDQTLYWESADLKAALTKAAVENVDNGVLLLNKLGLGVSTGTSFTPFSHVGTEAFVSLDKFFPEYPDLQKRKELFYTAGYQIEFSTPVPRLLMQRLVHICSIIRKPALIFEAGLILQEGCVETLFHLLNQDKGDGCTLTLITHTVKGNKSSVEEKDIEQIVWNTLNTYKIVLKFALKEIGLPFNRKFVGQRATAKDGIVELISSHKLGSPEEGPSSVQLCLHCGSNPKATSLTWILHQSLHSSCLDSSMFMIDTGENALDTDDDTLSKSRVEGSMLKVEPNETAIVKSAISSGQQTGFKILLSSVSGDSISFGMGNQYLKATRKFLEEIYLNIETGKLISKAHPSEERVITTCKPELLPRQGDLLSFELKFNNAKPNLPDLVISRNNELIAACSIPNRFYMPFVRTENSKVSMMIYPLYNYLDSVDEIKEGMKLEAKDRLNPSLICVATIAKVMPDGQVLIHFDGWTDRYDYVAEPTSPDLHPIGWMKQNAAGDRTIRQILQAPNKYHRPDFDWKRYCVEEQHSPPVPFSWFTEEQIQGTPPDLTNEISNNFTTHKIDSSFALPCYSLKNRPKVYEYTILKRSVMNQQLFNFFISHNKFFCLLPSGLTLETLRNPSLMALMDFSKQNVHILCPGLKMELLHFVDSKGCKFTDEASIEELSVFLQFCYTGLLLQNETLPPNCTELVQGMENAPSNTDGNLMMLKLCFLYQTILEFLSHRQTNKDVKSPRVAIEVFEKALKSKEYSDGKFAGTDANVKCRGHSMSMMTNRDLTEVSMEDFRQVFPFMTRLEFSDNHLETLPEDFFHSFKALEILNVSNNKLTQLPDGIGKLKDLTHLDLSTNHIEKLPADLPELAETLTYLAISNNPFNELPDAVSKLTNLEDLLAENIGVVANMSMLTNLKKLQVLNLGKNKFWDIPEGLRDLPLTSLDLSGVPWFPVSMFQSYRAFIQTLNVNMVTAAMTEEEKTALFKAADADMSSNLTSDEVFNMNYDILFPNYPRFGEGRFQYTESGGIPPIIFEMKHLKKLTLQYHGIRTVNDDIKNLTELTELDLSFNPKLTSLSAELGGLSLKQLHLKDCIVLNTPPKEIVSRGFMAIMGYLKRLRLGASPCKRTKLMLVGLGGAGKTSLVQSLMNNKYRAYMDADEPITDGIDIKTWQIPIENNKDMLTYSVWDFAGQTVYYNTHQFFLSNRAVYLLLWNVRQGYEHAGLDFWLSSIACHAPKAPILVIGTHIDKVDKFKLPEEVLKLRYPQIGGFHYVSAYTGAGVNELKAVIIKQTLEQKYMGEKIPEAWLTLEKNLIKYREEKRVDLLPLKTLGGIGTTCGIFDNTELIQAIQFLHDLGAVQFFNKDFLRDMVVIDPQWIIDVMACLVTVIEGAVVDGKLKLTDVKVVWKDYPADLHPWLLRLTEEFDLTCPLGDEEASIVPCLLPDEEPKYNWPHANLEKNIRESIIIYKFQYLPAGLFNRAQVRLNAYSKGALIWKRGSFMKKNDHKALMLQTGDQEVVVRSQGFRPENFLFIVHEMIETLILESYSGVSYDFMVPCLDCLNMNVKDPSMVSHNRIQRAMEMNVPFIQCDKFFHILSIQEVKDSMPSDKMSDMDNHLRNSVRELIDLTQETTINVFFIYSTKNVPDLKDEKKIVNPARIMEDLRAQGSFKVSYTDKPESSNMEALTLTIKSTDVVIIGMSDDFCSNAECKKLLLYIKDVLRLPVLLCLLGTTKKWQKGDLNMAFGAEVYVDMQKIERYEHKIKELYDSIKKKASISKKVNQQKGCKCFISYCWSNSHDAINKGSRSVEGALGDWKGSDPREVKSFLASKGIECWLDVEKVGGTGLFTSIADGLREAEVMVAFVSNEYVNSKNCVMEFRYGLTTLRIPVIVVVVGSGYEWERSEVGLLAVGHKCQKINLQYHNETGYLELLSVVQDKLKDTDQGSEVSNTDTQRNVAFQEVLELTQRKFLRHITTSIISNDLQPYPCLFVVDFISDKEKVDWENAETEKLKAAGKPKDEKANNEEKNEKANVLKGTDEAIVEAKVYHSKFCFRLFCEHQQGWHVMPSIIPFPELEGSDEQQLIDTAAPYLARLLAISKHSNIEMQCLSTPEGGIFQQRIEEIGVKSASDFKEEYLSLRETVMQQDNHKIFNHLSRCQVNGKMVWLCETHKKASRSKTEERYNIDIPLPKDELPDDFVPNEEIPENKPVERAEKKVPKVFNRRAESKSKPRLDRQTSQACSVM